MLRGEQLHEDLLPPTLKRVLEAWGTDMDAVTQCCREMHVTHTRLYNKQRTLQASFEKFSHSKLYVPFSSTYPVECQYFPLLSMPSIRPRPLHASTEGSHFAYWRMGTEGGPGVGS